jgi:hypothetical protein
MNPRDIPAILGHGYGEDGTTSSIRIEDEDNTNGVEIPGGFWPAEERERALFGGVFDEEVFSDFSGDPK